MRIRMGQLGSRWIMRLLAPLAFLATSCMNPEAHAPKAGGAATTTAQPRDTVPEWIRLRIPPVRLREAPASATALEPTAEAFDVLLTPEEALVEGKTVSTAPIDEAQLAQGFEELAHALKALSRERYGEDPARTPPVRFWVDDRTGAPVLASAVRAVAREGFERGELVFATGGEFRKLDFACRKDERGTLLITQHVNGRLPPEVIQENVRARFDRLGACYDEGLGRDPRLTGKVLVRFVVGRDGSVTNVGAGKVEDGPLNDERVVECILAEFRQMKFPSPEGGIVTVTYPLQFSPADDGSSENSRAPDVPGLDP